jgi:hypothetical protein
MIRRSRHSLPPVETFGSSTPSAAASARTASVVDSASAVGVLPAFRRFSTPCSFATGLLPR